MFIALFADLSLVVVVSEVTSVDGCGGDDTPMSDCLLSIGDTAGGACKVAIGSTLSAFPGISNDALNDTLFLLLTCGEFSCDEEPFPFPELPIGIVDILLADIGF
jgi:hypothetical protein